MEEMTISLQRNTAYIHDNNDTFVQVCFTKYMRVIHLNVYAIYVCMHFVLDNTLCRSNPCMNGGTCANRCDKYICHCPVGIYGDGCQTSTYGTNIGYDNNFSSKIVMHIS